MSITGQLWYAGEGSQEGVTPEPADSHGDERIGYVDSDGSSGPGDEAYITQSSDLSEQYDVELDTANNLYFGLTTNGNTGQFILYDEKITTGPVAASTSNLLSSLSIGQPQNYDYVNGFAVDYVHHVIYIGLFGGSSSSNEIGIIEVSYNPINGQLTTAYNQSSDTGGMLLTNTSTSGVYTNGSNFFIDPTAQKLYYIDYDDGSAAVPYGYASQYTNGIYVVSTTSDNPQPVLLSEVNGVSDFPVAQDSNGDQQIIAAMAVDLQKGLIYFVTDEKSSNGSTFNGVYDTSEDALYYMPIGGGAATKMTLPAGVTLGLPSSSAANSTTQTSGMTLDDNGQVLYINDQAVQDSSSRVVSLTLSADGKSITAGNNDFYNIDDNDNLNGESFSSQTYSDANPQGLTFAALPTVTAGATIVATQGGAAVQADAALTLTDPDSNIASATVQITAHATAGDVLGINGTTYTSTATNVTVDGYTFAVTWSSSTYTLTIATPAGAASGAATPAQYAAILDEVTYRDTGSGTATGRTLTWTAYDGEAGNPVDTSYNQKTSAVTTDTPPVLTLSPTAVSYTGDTTPIALQPGLTLSEASGGNISSAVVTLAGGYAGDGDVLAVSGQSSSISYDGKTFALAYSGAGATETLTITGTGTASDYQYLLENVQFSTSVADPTNSGAKPTRTVTIQATDASGATGSASGSETVTLSALTAPTLTNFAAVSTYALEGGAALTILQTSPAPTIASAANPTGASVTISSAQAGDLLGLELNGTFTSFGASATSETVDGATFGVSWNSTSHVLSITGSASVAAYEAILADVAYQDGSADAGFASTHPTRSISFSVSNAAGASATATTVSIDRAPITAAHAASVVQGATFSGVALGDTDPDGDAVTVTGVTAPTNATVTFSGGIYTVTPNAGYAGGALTINANNDTYSYTAPSSGAGAHAGDLSAYATGSHPTDSFTYTISDGHGGTATETLVFTLDRPPTTILSDTSAAYAGTPVQLQTGVTVADIDGDNIAGATVTISGGFSGDGDQIHYGSATGDLVGASTTETANGSTFTLSYTAASESLSISGTGTGAQYQTLLDSLYFGSSAADPTNAGANTSRTVSFTVADPSGATSAAQLESVSVAPAAPTIGALANHTGSGATDLTDHAYVELTGTAAADSTVTLYNGSAAIGSGTADGNGHFDITATSALTDGSYDLTATAGFGTATSSVSGAFAVTVDTTAPTASLDAQTLTNDTGYSSTDGVTSDGAVTLTGTVADSGGSGVAGVEVFNGAVDLGAATVTGSGWSFTATLGQGSYALNAVATDEAGNTTSTTTAAAVVVDTTAPTLGAVTTTPASGDVHAGDVISFTVTPSEAVVVTGTPELTLSNGETASYTGATGSSVSSLTFSYTVAGGQYDADLQVTGVNLNGGTIQDLAGNSLSGGASADTTLGVDTAPPALTLAATATDAVQGGAAIAALGSVTITDTDGGGTLSGGAVSVVGGAAGDVLNVTGLSGGLFDNITVTGAGTDSLSFSGVDTVADYDALLAAVTYQDTGTDTTTSGAHATRTLDWSVSDGALSSSATPVALTLDRPPVTANVSAALAANGSASGDALNGVVDPDNSTASFSVTQAALGAATPTAVGSSGSTLIHGTYGDLSIAADGSYTYVAGATPAEVAAINAVQGQHPTDSFTLTVADTDGPATAPETLSFVLDRAPVLTLSNNNVVYGTGGAPVQLQAGAGLSEADGDTMSGATVQIAGGFTGDGDELHYGGASGDLIGASTTETFGTDSFLLSFDSSSETLTITGTGSRAEYQGLIDNLYFDSTAADPSNAGANASRTVSYTVTETPGADSPTVTETIGIAPVAPTISALANTTGQGGPTLTNHAQVELTGTAAANSTVTLYNGASAIGSGTADGSGHFDFVASTALADGSYNLTATAAYGSAASGASSAFSVSVDATAPAITFDSETLTSDTGYDNTDGVTSNGEVTLTGTAADSGSGLAEVVVYNGGDFIGAATLNGGSWSLTTTLAPGTYNLYAEAIDNADNDSYTAPAATLVVDTTAPTLVAVTTSQTSGAVHAGDSISITVTPSEAVVVTGTPELTLSNGQVATYTGTTGASVSSLSFTYTVAAGQYTSDLQVTGLALNGGTIQDLAGNSLSGGVANTDTTLGVDTTPPALTLATAPTDAVQGGAPIIALATATIADSDGPGTFTGGTVTVDAGGSGDVLNVAGLVGDQFDNITVTGVGTDSLTFSGVDTLADYQALLAAVTYQDTGTDTATSSAHATRSLDWSLSNGSLSSNTAVTTLTLDRAPTVANISDTVLSTGATSGNATAGASDPDNAAATFTITQAAAGASSATAVAASGTTTIHGTYGDLVIAADGTYTYTVGADATEAAALAAVSGSHATDTFALTVADSDGPATASETATFTIDRAPAVSLGQTSAAYSAGGSAVQLQTTTTVSDADGDLISSAAVQIGGGFAGDGDQLVYGGPGGTVLGSAAVSENGLSLSYDAGTQTLTISGVADGDTYQTVLDNLYYASTASDPTNAGAEAGRTIDFTVTEAAGVQSAAASETISLTTPFAATAAVVSQDFDALNAETWATPVTITDSLPLTLTAVQAIDDTAALAKTVRADGGPVAVEVVDTAADVAAQIDALAGDASLVSITLSDNQPLAITWAQDQADQAALAKIVGPHEVVVTGVTGEAYTSFSETTDASGHILSETTSGYTGQPYASITDTFDASGHLTGATSYDAQGDVLVTIVETYDSNGDESSYSVTGLTGEPYTGYSDSFDSAGHLISQTTSGYSGQPYASITDTFDASGHLTGATSYDAQGDVLVTIVETYDSNGDESSYSVTGLTGEPYTGYSETFDGAGNVTSQTFSGYSGQGYTALTETFDSNGVLTSQTYSGYTGQAYESITDTVDSSGRLTSAVSYDASHNPLVTITETYDSNGQESSYAVSGLTGGDFTSYSDSFDNAGHLISETRSGYTGQAYTSITDTFDSAGRLTGAISYDASGQPVVSITETYDSNGNEASYSITGVTGEPYTGYTNIYGADGSLLAQSFHNTDGTETDYAFAAGQTIASSSLNQLEIADGDDTFVIGPNFGHDTMRGYSGGNDSFDISSQLFANFDAMLAHASDDGMGDTLITYDAADTFLIVGLTPTQLAQHAADFHFV